MTGSTSAASTPSSTYAGNRRIIDVDSHVIELDDFL